MKTLWTTPAVVGVISLGLIVNPAMPQTPDYRAVEPLMIINADGTGLKQFVSVEGYEFFSSPVWSPDGKSLALIATVPPLRRQLVLLQEPGEDQKVVVRVDGRDHRVLGTHVAWSSDSKQLLVEYLGGGGDTTPRQLYIFDAVSDDAPELLLGQDPERYSGDMTWSPDGKKIVFVSCAP